LEEQKRENKRREKEAARIKDIPQIRNIN